MDPKSRNPSGLDRTAIVAAEAAYRLWCSGIPVFVAAPKSKPVPAAESKLVIQEQWEMLVENCAEHDKMLLNCHCGFCERLKRISVILMEIFG